MGIELLPEFIRENYEIHDFKHATSVLYHDFREEWYDIINVLTGFRLKRSWIIVGGGRKSMVAEAFDSKLSDLGWVEKEFDISIKVDQVLSETPTHKVDCFKNGIALEIEWNNKDPFFDRDLNNFRLLFDLRAIDVGVIITRCDHLQELFDDLGRGSSYGSSTTHIAKLLPKIRGGGGGGCPILVFGIKKTLYDKHE